MTHYLFFESIMIVSESRETTAPSYRDAETALMLRVRRDEAGAFAKLVDLYGSKIFARIFRCLQDRQEAEDATQEVFLRLYRARKRYRARARLATWIFHVVRNVIRNNLRSRRRRLGLSFLVIEPTFGTESSHGQPTFDSPALLLERSELRRIVRCAMGELVERQRTVLEMYQFHDYSYAEIGAELGLSLKATKSLLHRARSQLRGSLERLLPDMI